MILFGGNVCGTLTTTSPNSTIQLHGIPRAMSRNELLVCQLVIAQVGYILTARSSDWRSEAQTERLLRLGDTPIEELANARYGRVGLDMVDVHPARESLPGR